jgi:hypothetical protein
MTKRMYAVQVTIVVDCRENTYFTRELPTFYLDPDVQGITSREHARTIAAKIVGLDSAGILHEHVDGYTIHVEEV